MSSSERVPDPLDDGVDEIVGALASPSVVEAARAESSLLARPEPARVVASLRARLALATWPEDARRRAVRLLGELSGDGAVDALLEAARSTSRILRAAATLALGRKGDDPRASDAVLALLHDPSRDVRAAACWSLDRLRPGSRAIPGIARALREVEARTAAERPQLARAALAPEIRQEQRDLLRALDPLVDDPALPAALRPLVPELLAIARDPAAEDPDVRLDAASRAAAILARTGERAAALGLAAILDDGVARNGEVLDSVAFALGELGGPEAEAALGRELTRPRLRSFEAAGYPETVRAALLRARRPS